MDLAQEVKGRAIFRLLLKLLFVALDDVYVEGLVHVSDLGSDYYHFDAAKHLLLGERTAKRYRLGDRVVVKVARVDLETSKIDFVLEEGPTR